MHLTGIKKVHIIILIIIVASLVSAVFIMKNRRSLPEDTTFALTPGGDERITVYSYPDSKFLSTSSDPLEGKTYMGNRFTASWESAAEVGDISRWYREKLISQGWTLDLPANEGNSDIQLSYFYNDKYNLYISVYKDANPGKTRVVSEYQTRHSDTAEIGEENEETIGEGEISEREKVIK